MKKDEDQQMYQKEKNNSVEVIVRVGLITIIIWDILVPLVFLKEKIIIIILHIREIKISKKILNKF